MQLFAYSFYSRVPADLRKFLRKHSADMHDDMFPKWLGPFFIALYIVIDSKQVLDQKLTLGT